MPTSSSTTELRNRKIKHSSISKPDENETKNDIKEEKSPLFKPFLYLISQILLGAYLMFVVSTKYAAYLKNLHENNLWFSNLKVRFLVFGFFLKA